MLSDQKRRRLYDQTHHLAQCSEKPDPAHNLHNDKSGSYGNSDYLFFSADDLLEMLGMEDDLFLGGEADVGQGWSFSLWDEGHDEDEQFGFMFGML